MNGETLLPKKVSSSQRSPSGWNREQLYRRSRKQCTSNFSFPSELTFPLGVQLCTIKLLKKAASPPAFPSGLVGSPSDLHWCVWEHENVNRAYFLACKKQSWIFRHKYIKNEKNTNTMYWTKHQLASTEKHSNQWGFLWILIFRISAPNLEPELQHKV